MSAAAFDHAYLGRLLGAPEIQAHFTPEADVAAMLRFEAALAGAQAAEGMIPAAAAARIATVAGAFVPDGERLAIAAMRDGLIVPELIAQLKAAVGDPHAGHVHLGSTSQDVIDTGLMLRLKTVVALLDKKIASVLHRLDTRMASYGTLPLMGRTRMQAALPVTFGHRIAQWRAPIEDARRRLTELSPRLLVIQLGGPVGTRREFGDKADAIAVRLAEALDLGVGEGSWHSNRTRIAEFGSVLSLLTGALGKLGQDLVLMSQNEVAEVVLRSGGTSSAMPHKVNPVKAEILVALARYNAGQLGILHQALVHENERSGAAWTLEWLTLPPMVVTAGASLNLAERALDETDFVVR